MVPDEWSKLDVISQASPDWPLKKLTKFSTQERNSFVNGPFGSDLLSSELVDSGVPIIYIRDITDGRYQRKSTVHVTHEKASALPACKTEYGDLLVTKVGDPPCEAAVYTENDNAIVTQDVIRIKTGDIDLSTFLSNMLNSDIGKRQVKRIKIAGTRERVSLTDFKSIKFPFPPESDRKIIAKILSTWDKAIATVEKLIANSRQQKKALMQQLLTGKKRLGSAGGSPAQAGQRPALPGGGEWKYKKISQIAKRIQRKSDGGDNPVLTISSLSGFVRQDEKYSRYMAGKSVENYILLERGEFAYNKGNSKTYEFGCVFDLETYQKGLVPHVYVCFKLNEGLSHRYFKYLFEADYLKPQLGRLVNTGVRNNGLLNIKPSEFLDTKVPVPSFDEQEKIADILHAASLQLRQLESELELLRQEKKALMQQLLTGKRRVKLGSAGGPPARTHG